VIIPTKGRPRQVAETLVSVGRQSLRPGAVVVSCTEAGDVPALDVPGLPVTVVMGSAGTSAQRNRAVDALPDGVETVTFLDDDVELHPDYLAEVREQFAREPRCVCFHGLFVLDGTVVGQLSRDEARAALASAKVQRRLHESAGAAGGNLNVRRSALSAERFDERLVLYGLYEDRDFAARCARLGIVGHADGPLAVHLGESSGRRSETSYGFSQVMNAFYLARKGSDSWRWALALVARSAGGSLARLASSERGPRLRRLRGNAIALAHLLRGRVDPEHAASL